MNEPIQEFAGGELVRFQIREGDRFVLSFKQPIPMEHVARVQEMWQSFVGDPTAKLLILDNGATLSKFNVNDLKEMMK